MPPQNRHFRPGDYIFKEGQPSNCIYIIQKGTVDIKKMKGAGYVIINRIYANEVLGELSFFDKKPRSAAAQAMTEVDAIEIDFESLEKIYAQVPKYLKTIIECLADRLRKSTDMVRTLQKNVEADAPIQLDQSADEPDEADVMAAITGERPPKKEPIEDPDDDSSKE